ncbi:glycoside hydrolase family 2 protein [Pinibacter soli]|uniref:Glycoside hydrolase family 2 TIM barrel-domain containing protein n=1 Tax=Pinibacter soli TaxID=3044211 RepID=A0ABT6R7D3_9BACT|nr:sugar-binding domain-containing protein [Pinibacter soli]MDI3318351.1 glycoside hydrolase family 2 TIM barrel-domain containing protein [Pinibacter soli]
MKIFSRPVFYIPVMISLFVVKFTHAQNSAQNEIASGWQMKEAAKVTASGALISTTSFTSKDWYEAVVPGTVLTTLVHNKVYPDPLYGENNRPDKIPETLCRTDYWYRAAFAVPKNYNGKKIWLNFDGINYEADVWVNGKQVGKMKGAFARGIFDITGIVSAGSKAVVAVHVSPQPNPGISHEHTIKDGMGPNGGQSAIDGPTFLCSIGWDWIPAIRDRNTGIWQKVFLASTGAVRIKDPLVTSDVSLPNRKSADVSIRATVENTTDKPVQGILKGSFGNVVFEQAVTLTANSSQELIFDPRKFAQLHVSNPNLWWPNGYGPQNLYNLKLSFEVNGQLSDSKNISFGIRKITYGLEDAENLTVTVNGVKVFCKGGNWGMDEAMKRVSRARLEAQVRMHQIANYTMIRNWVGQSTNEDLYDLCDKYGIMLWDEFFQPNPGDGPNPTDIGLYIANVREKIVRFRNHPSIAIWCARNEGYPPANIDSALRKLMRELEPVRLYQPSSTEGRGVNSGGPYRWRKPVEYYTFNEAFKTEIGSMSVPTLQSIHGMMPKEDWEVINNDWAEHDFANGAQKGLNYRTMIDERYGKVINLADFVRKAQLANYEAFRAMYEGRNAKLFNPATGVITWMSNPAQPSFVWQLYHHDLEPNASLFAVRKGCEPVHIQLNEKENTVQVINNLPNTFNGKAQITVYNLDGTVVLQRSAAVSAAASSATTIGNLSVTANSSVYFVQLILNDVTGKQVSNNFYWQALPSNADKLSDLDKLAVVKLLATVSREDKGGKCLLHVTLRNPTTKPALMAHLQLYGKKSKERVLPVYYTDNYISLAPNESRAITIEADASQLKGDQPLILIDGWNVDVVPVSGAASIELNKVSQVSTWPQTGLPVKK